LDYLDAFEQLQQQDRELIMQTHREVIQKIMFLRGSSKLYLSKEVTSHTKLNTILAMYPTARFIINLRRSNEFIGSLLRLIQVSTLCKTGVDMYAGKSKFKSLLIKRMQNDCSMLFDFVEHRGYDNIPSKPLLICLAYSLLIEDPITSIQYVYQKLKLKMSPVYLKKLQSVQQKQYNRERGYNYEKEQTEGFDQFNALVAKYSKKIYKCGSIKEPHLYRKGSIAEPHLYRKGSIPEPHLYRKGSTPEPHLYRKGSIPEPHLYRKGSMQVPHSYKKRFNKETSPL